VELLLPAREGGGRLGHDVRRPRHAFDATGHEDRSVAVGDRMGGAHHGLQPRAAQAVDRLSRHVDRQPREERRHPADVAVVLPRLVGSAEDHVVDHQGVDARALDEGVNDVRGHVVGPDVLQGATVSAERCAQGVDDDGSPSGVAAHGVDATRLARMPTIGTWICTLG
jgi:hypothetical protein